MSQQMEMQPTQLPSAHPVVRQRRDGRWKAYVPVEPGAHNTKKSLGSFATYTEVGMQGNGSQCLHSRHCMAALLTTFSGPCACRHAWRMAQPTMPHSSTGHQPTTGKLRLEQLHGTSLMGKCFCSDV